MGLNVKVGMLVRRAGGGGTEEEAAEDKTGAETGDAETGAAWGLTGCVCGETDACVMARSGRQVGVASLDVFPG